MFAIARMSSDSIRLLAAPHYIVAPSRIVLLILMYGLASGRCHASDVAAMYELTDLRTRLCGLRFSKDMNVNHAA